MPKGKTKGKGKSKRVLRKRQKQKALGGSLLKVPRLHGMMKKYSQADPFPSYYDCKMMFTESLSFTAGTAGVFAAPYVYSCNSVYDPRFTSGGRACYGYNQMAALYRRYLVKGVKVNIRFFDPDSSGMGGGILLQGSDSVGVMTGISPDIIDEQPTSWTCFIPDSGPQEKTFKQYIPVASVEGINRIQFESAQADYIGLIGSTSYPVKQPTIQVSGCNWKATASGVILATVHLTYYVRWYDRILQASS